MQIKLEEHKRNELKKIKLPVKMGPYSQYQLTKYCQYFAIPAVQNPEVLGVQ